MMFRLSPMWIVTMFLLAEGMVATAEQTYVLWPDGAPGALGKEDQDVPSMTAYLPEPERAGGSAVVICPGGAYGVLAPHEGKPIAEWLNSIGVAGFVVKYRLGPRYHHPCQLQDASQAVRMVRARAAEWKIDPSKVGILGFSAGGHLASTVGTHFDAGDKNSDDPVARESSRPNLMILIYPVISMTAFPHLGSRRNLLGDAPSQELLDLLSNEKQVTAETPPAFLVHTAADKGVPCENSLMFAEALRKAGVPVELHIFERGNHGFGLGGDDPVLSTWPKLCAEWLRVQGFRA